MSPSPARSAARVARPVAGFARVLCMGLGVGLVSGVGAVAPRGAAAEDLDGSLGALPGETTRSVDAWLANVCGETLTRRMLVRELGEKDPDEPAVVYERKLRERLVLRTINGVLAWKARLFGLDPRPSSVDEVLEKEAAAAVKAAREREPGITFEELLRKRGQSREEFRALIARELLVQNYWHILINGAPGKRAQLDVEPAPAECRRLYERHRAAFDEAAGVRLATFLASPERFLESVGDRYDAAMDAARARVTALAAEVAAGKAPADVARANRLEKRVDWNETGGEAWLEKGRGGTAVAEVDVWAFDPARRKGDTHVAEVSGGKLASYVVLGVRPTRTKTYDEALPDVMTRIRLTRLKRFRMQHMIESLVAAPVKPPGLVEDIVEQLRAELLRLDEDPVDREIRLR